MPAPGGGWDASAASAEGPAAEALTHLTPQRAPDDATRAACAGLAGGGGARLRDTAHCATLWPGPAIGGWT